MGRPMEPLYVSGLTPEKQHDDDAAFDLSYVGNSDVWLGPFERAMLTCGFIIEIPEGYVGLVCPRSGLALKHGVTVLNAPGVIDPGFRGEVGVILINLSSNPIVFHPGDRIAQLLIVPGGEFRIIHALPENLIATTRGEDGFGSTGLA